jgi:hypothetical protein
MQSSGADFVLSLYITMKKFITLIVLALLWLVNPALSQDGGSGDGGQKEKTETGRAARRKAKKEWKEKRRKDMSDAQAKKNYNKKYNSKKVRKRMKKNEKKAKRNNEHKREFFVKRWFKKKH